MSAIVQMALFDAGMPPAAGRVRQPRRSGAPRPALRLCVLGSGSGGNCTVVQDGNAAVLLDLGFGPRTTATRLEQAGLSLDHVQAVCLTHLDQDHFRRSWPRTLLARQLPLFLHHWHAADLARLRGGSELFDAGLVQLFDTESFQLTAGIVGQGVRLQHDRQGTIGYRLQSTRRPFGGAIGYATDLGHAPPRLIEHFAGVDLLCLESNYDERMTLTSSRPSFVNRRNLSDSGHLSNEQAFAAVQAIDAASPVGLPRHVLLMHRSDQCNHPTKVRRVFEQDPLLTGRFTLTQQRRRSRWFAARPLRAVRRFQLAMPFGLPAAADAAAALPS